MSRSKSSYFATDRNSCPLAMVAFAALELEGDENPESVAICEGAICDQINRKINFDEASNILHMYANTTAPAKLIHKVLNAIDHHKPVIGCSENKSSSRACKMWRPEEDILLLAAIHRFGLGDWKSISNFVGGGRSRSQCSQRWGRAMDPRIAKAPWTEDEDEILLKLVKEYGEHSWANIARKMASRSDVQCRYRYFLITKKTSTPRKSKTEISLKDSSSSSEDKAIESPISTNSIIPNQNNDNLLRRVVFPSVDQLLTGRMNQPSSLDFFIPPLRLPITVQPTTSVFVNCRY